MKNFNSILHDIFPPILFKIWRKIHRHPTPVIVPLPKRERKGNRIVVIANGPSLNKTVELYKQELQDTECVMVNFSALTPLYEELKPTIYVMADAGFIHHREDSVNEAVKNLINKIVQDTTWPMTIVLPSQLQTWEAIEKFKSNSNIKVLLDYSNYQCLPEPQLFDAMDCNQVCPPTYTVTSYALYLAVYFGYKEIYLVGADTSIIKDIYVDQVTNDLFTIDTHFYQNQEVCPEPLDPQKHGRRYHCTMENLMHEVYMDLWEYNMLQRYADWKGVKIYNASEYSLIDCFERRKLR